MSGVFRHVDANGRVTYSDLPPSEPGRVDVLSSSGNRTSDEDARKAHKDAVTYIKEAQKRGPKIKDYLEYIQYLRDKGRFWRWEKAMQDLRREDTEAWMKLQKYPQFRPLLNRALGLQAGEKNLTVGIGLITGKYTGSVEKWLETTVKDMMKVDRWGPYADVLGAKASTLLDPQPTTYSNSRWGQFAKVEDPKAVQASKDAAKKLEASRAAIRASRATAVTRVLNPLIDLGIGALDTDFFKGISAVEGMRLGTRLVEKGILTPDEALELRGMMARAEFDQARALIEAGAERATGGR
ncbi:DUF4124 domain-containing protein [Ralstonia solanacearum]|uniref:DUF4124 domain-containing protein n=1 Tax=Ralstonia solanacearum K60 TaxID=1091042 RepID=A0AAP8D2G5_RALSL|nr:DUF4124 domain-containing protein [Ralstonia solanacearum]MBT1539099.1 DUF4124 domain-containing protein [Ralstonia solanacearum]OYQ10118.1 DUF4124 domain-containing protein [Ralstonia solanacearum K60]QOK84673.1 DUF4124 domain-containing protein [Ralstonia solanacearum]RIJ83876.1 DUF4124 domain-containing protein [Ralstonia solanacearum]